MNWSDWKPQMAGHGETARPWLVWRYTLSPSPERAEQHRSKTGRVLRYSTAEAARAAARELNRAARKTAN